MEQQEAKSYPAGYKPMTKEEFVRRMLSDVHKKILAQKEKERQKNRIINDYRGESITKYQHKMHMMNRRGRV